MSGCQYGVQSTVRLFMWCSKVPDLPKLVDQTLHDRILERRQTTQVMWRASRKNEDNTTILIHNSPLHHALVGSGTERVQQYFIQSQDQPEVRKETFVIP
jgi:hypothetical protein